MSYDPIDDSECVRIDLTDDLLAKSKIACYMFNQEFENSEGKDKPFTPKAFPGKAIVICIPVDDLLQIQIYLDADEHVWDSKFMYNGQFCKLSPEQMQQFFSSEFYQKMLYSLAKRWPVSDPFYADLYNAVVEKQLRIGIIPHDELEEAEKAGSITEIEHDYEINQPNKNIHLANKDVTGDGKRDYTGSGRRIVQFGNNGVSVKSAKFFCWPRPGKEFKWNTWKDWHKIRPFCKMQFKHNGRTYMVALTKLVDEQFDNRGFRGADVEWRPPFAWLSPEEVQQCLQLSIVQKFIHGCKKRVKKYLDMTPEEVHAQIDKPERVTVDEIAKTQRIIRHMVQQELNEPHIDNYKYDS